MSLTATERIDLLNIGLMLVSACVAMILPFELFLLVYAVLGPLHYLTEISWLHDRGYFTKGRYDAVWLLVIGFILMLNYFGKHIELVFPPMFDASLMFIAFLSALIFVTVKNTIYKIGGIILLVFASQAGQNYNYFFTVFIPTLVHVYVFTALFVIYGAIKSKSRLGIVSVAVMLLIPFALYNIYPDNAFYPAQEYSRGAYKPFRILNIVWLRFVEHIPNPPRPEGWNDIVFSSTQGILLMRFIAFAYTYHYLNWFSKTKVIQWHNIPRIRFVLVIVTWLASIGIYMYNYVLGMQWLLFLSFMHVLLELPLNFISIMGIGNFLRGKVFKTARS